jgi:hypothetical protein
MTAATQRMLEIANRLESSEDPDASLKRILENEIRRRLNRYELVNRRLQSKYGMTFEEFRDRDIVQQRGYSFEVEGDFCDWEMAISGIRSLKQDLAELGR